jgi:23S rRNA (uracil1939-C5)-methyltransferase
VRILLQRAGPESLETPDGARDAGELWYGIAGTDLRLTFSAGDFIQVNAAMNARLVALALELLAPDRATRVLDLYCGIGNFTLPLARRAAWALGVEGAAGMVERARRNARLNGIDNAEFRVADLAAGGAAQVWRRESFDAVLLDPPRAGAAAVLEDAAATGARRILYVSCHPGTLARDAGTLVNRLGFTLSAAGVLDMFPATSHVESVALFDRP